MNDLEQRVLKLEGILGRGNFNSSTVQQKDANFNGKFKLVNRTSLPAYCAAGEMSVTNGVPYVCKTTNVWQAVGGTGFGGVVTSGGGGTVPAGWSLSRNGTTHVYTLTHNLGTTSYSVVAMAHDNDVANFHYPILVRNANTFTIAFDNNSAVAGDTDFTFILTLI